MTNNVSKEQVASARCADLYDFLIKYYDSKFKHEGDSIRPRITTAYLLKKVIMDIKTFPLEKQGIP